MILNMNTVILRKLQRTELEILSVIDKFCYEHNIIYSLYAGTAIGAIRHKGFIPWDDDIDIAMTRGEYIKFCKEWRKSPVEGYYHELLVSDPNCGTCHSKIRKEGTLLLSKGDIEKKGHHGIWVDIFPLDKVTSTNKKQILAVARKLIMLSRANVKKTNDSISKKLIRDAIIFMYPDMKRHKDIIKCVKMMNDNDRKVDQEFVWMDLSAIFMFKYNYPSSVTDGIIKVKFEGKQFNLYSGYDEMLRSYYGDYMKLPPVSERVCKHNPVKVKF